MKIIKRLIGTLFLIVITALSACNGNSEAISTKLEKHIIVGNYNIDISFPKNWKAETDSKPFDLQCSNGNSYASIFVYYKVDLAEGQNPLDLFHIQNNDILSKRSNVEIINKEQTEKRDKKQIHSILYSAEKDGIKNYYYCNLVEFGEDTDRFVWVLFTAIPSYSLANIDIWKKIVASAVLTQ